MDELSQWSIAVVSGGTIASLLALFNKSGSDFKDGFEPKRKRNEKK